MGPMTEQTLWAIHSQNWKVVYAVYAVYAIFIWILFESFLQTTVLELVYSSAVLQSEEFPVKKSDRLDDLNIWRVTRLCLKDKTKWFGMFGDVHFLLVQTGSHLQPLSQLIAIGQGSQHQRPLILKGAASAYSTFAWHPSFRQSLPCTTKAIVLVFEVLWRSTLTFCWESYKKYLYIMYIMYIPFPVVVDPRLGQMRSWQHLSRGPHCAYSWSHGLHVVNWNLPGVWNHGEWSEQFFNRVSCMMLYGFAMFCARLCTFVYYQIINDFSKGVVLCHGTATWLWPSPSGKGSHHGSRGGNVQLPSLDGWGGAKPSEVHNLEISNGKWSKWSTPELSVGISNTGQLSRAAKPGVFVPSSSCKNATRAPAVLVWWTQLRSQTPANPELLAQWQRYHHVHG